MLSSNLKKLAGAGLLALASALPSAGYAADDMIARSDIDRIAEIAKGYGSVTAPQSNDKGLLWLEIKTEGHKYFIDVYADAYGGGFTQTQFENAFDMFLKDYADYRKIFQ
jgi:hypothetical protein